MIKQILINWLYNIKKLSKEQLAINFSFYYFIYRSNMKAFFYTVFR